MNGFVNGIKPKATHAGQAERLVYVVSRSGHRQSYLDILGPMFNLQPVSGRMTSALFGRLVRAECLLFASLDDDMASFSLVSAARNLLGRPTVALFLRAQKCFETGRWFYPLKRAAFRILRKFPLLTIATIIPFEVAPGYRQVANIGVHDPQYWDLHDGRNLRLPTPSILSKELADRASGRRILCALGSMSADKGLSFLAETLEQHPEILEHTLVVYAGRVAKESTDIAARLSVAGVVMIERFISDEELESLYCIADGIWACYSPRYDQASGVFGRAIQLGVTPIVRQGSIVAATASQYGMRHVEVPYGSHAALAKALRQLTSRADEQFEPYVSDRVARVGSWRRHFEELISAGLGDGFGVRQVREARAAK